MSLSLLSLSRGRSDRKRAVVDVVVDVVDILRKEDGCCCIQALEEARQLPRKTAATNAHVLLVIAGEVLIIMLLFIVIVKILFFVVVVSGSRCCDRILEAEFDNQQDVVLETSRDPDCRYDTDETQFGKHNILLMSESSYGKKYSSNSSSL
jgi:hypothetical protein